MAFPAAANMHALGEDHGVDGDGNLSFEEASIYAQNYNIVKSNDPVVTQKYSGLVKVSNMPFKDASQATTLKHFIDIIVNFGGAIDFATVKALLLQRRYGDLPPPLCTKLPVDKPHSMNLVVLQRTSLAADSAPLPFIILKWFMFEEKVKIEYAKAISHGIVHKIEYGVNFRSGSKGFLYMWERLGGFQSRHMTLSIEGPKRQKSKSELVQGIECIGK
jgi:hypothetical protein